MKPRVCVIRTDGTNCDKETQYAFSLVGANAEIVHLNSLIKKYDPASGRKLGLVDYDILAIPGGFSKGDYVASGKIFAIDMQRGLGDELARFIESGRPVIGICNGFQVLVKSRYLPDPKNREKQTTTLTYNNSGHFECDWVRLVQPRNSKCIWTRGIEAIDLPVAHGEGRFVGDKDLVERLFDNGQVVFQYTNNIDIMTMEFPYNPNGSVRSVAGICDPRGLVFGLMPHPERYNRPMNHRYATLQKSLGELPDHGLGLDIFRNGVEYCLG